MTTVLAVGDPEEEHVKAVVGEIRRRGHRAVVLNMSDVPQRVRVTAAVQDGLRIHGELEWDSGERLRLHEVDAVWLRRIADPRPEDGLQDRWHAVQECNHFLAGLAQALTGRCRWVNPPSALPLDGGWGKLRQLDAAREAGLPIPRTLATSDPARALEFVRSCGEGGAIWKPFACPEGQWTRDLRGVPEERFAAVRHAPGIFQERVEKELDLRVTVMGERVFACAISSQAEAESRTDYRPRCYALPRTEHALPGWLRDALVLLHRALGLAFGTCDLALDREGRYWFFESNQAGCWLRIGEAPGVTLLEPFADFLLDGR